MAVPAYIQFIEPVLRYLAANPAGALARDAHEAAASALSLTEAERQELLPSGAQPVFKNRAGWAHDRLKRAGLSQSPRRGFWRLTDEGLRFVKSAPAKLSAETLAKIADAALSTPIRAAGLSSEERFAASGITDDETHTPGAGPAVTASPDDRLEQALQELRASVAAELLESLLQVPPSQFEGIVLDLLHAMGYGASRSDLQRVGGSGDGGIDGIISLDRLGLEKVYVQAKRWQGPVGRPDVQGFYGALAGQRANKGVFITTSTFTAQATEFARSVERVVLVDGQRLAELMIDHEVGVSARTVKIPKLDGDYFEL